MGNDNIYEELRGYFPPEYDLTPEELEKEIELENKKREIALGMMRVSIATEEDKAPVIGKIRHSSISAMHTDCEIPVIKKAEPEALGEPEEKKQRPLLFGKKGGIEVVQKSK